MGNNENSFVQKSINYTWGAMFVAFAISSTYSFQSFEKKDGDGHYQSSEQATTPSVNAKPEALNKYFGVNEGYDVLVSPDQTKKMFNNKAFLKFKDDYKYVSLDYLIETESGEIYGFNPIGGVIYGKDAVNIYSGKKPLDQLLKLKKTISDINSLPGSLDESSPEVTGLKEKPNKPDAIKNANDNSAIDENAEVLEDTDLSKTKKISEEDLQKLIDSKFNTGVAKNENTPEDSKNEKPEVPVVKSQKLTDIETLRAQLKQRVQNDFGYIPNAKTAIEEHLGGSGPSVPQNTQTTNSKDVNPNQVNVRAIRETANAVYYKGERLPKVGFDANGNKVSEEQKRNQVKGLMNRISELGDQWSVVYKAKGEEKKKIAVFSDPTCPYCKKLHELMPEIQEAGVTVYHMFYNRSMAPNTVSDPRVVNVNEGLSNAWCSPNPKEALDSLYAGYSIPEAQCNNLNDKIDYPGNEHYLIGRIIDMSGTPYTITEDGEVIAGFASRGARQPENFLDSIGL